MAKILVASVPEGQSLLKDTFAGKHDLHIVETMSQAEAALAESELKPPQKGSSFDLVVCSVHFDDSRMFELLKYIRDTGHFDNLPFLVITSKSGLLPLDTTTRIAAELLGAAGFLELAGLPGPEAKRLLEEAVNMALKKPVKKVRMDDKKSRRK